MPDRPPSGARGRRRWRRLLFLAVALSAVYLAVEMVAFGTYWLVRGRVYSPAFVHAAQARIAGTIDVAGGAPALAMQDSGGDMTIHPYLGFVANHDTDDQMMLAPWGPEITTWGFADTAGIVRKRQSDRVLIGIFGGSVAEFFGAEGAAELERQLRGHPAYVGKRVEFVRMGLGGYKQPQQLFALTWLLAMGGELDLAINLDGFNDTTLGLLENEQRGVPMFFPRNWALLAEHAPDPVQRRHMGTATLLQDSRTWLAGFFGSRPLRWSVTAALVWELLDQTLAKSHAEHLLALQTHARTDAPFHITGPGPLPTPFDPNDPVAPDDLYAATACDLWQRCSRAMARVCAAHGIGYFHFLQPNQYFPASKALTADEQRTAIEPGSRYEPWVVRGYPRLRLAGAQLARDGIRFTDLTQIYADVAATVYIDNCCHVNALGNEILGRALAAAILQGAPREVVPVPEGRTLRAEPTALTFTRPFAHGDVRVFAEQDDVTYLATTFVSGDERIARVDRYGGVTAVRAGQTSVTIRHGGRDLTVPVRVELPPVMDLGGASAPAGLTRPTLATDSADGATLRLRVLRPGGDLPGALVLAADPAPRPFCRGMIFVPLASPFAQPIGGGAGEVTLRVALPPGLATGTVFAQALFKASDDPCGFAISNGLALTR